jgi:hypothetical protein
MSSTGANKSWIYLVAGAGAFVAAAVLIHHFSGKEEGATAQQANKVLEDIDALGPAKREANGLLNFTYFKDVFVLVQKHSKARFAEEKQGLLKKRRAFLKESKMPEYKELVKEMIQKEESMLGEMLQDCMDHIGINE